MKVANYCGDFAYSIFLLISYSRYLTNCRRTVKMRKNMLRYYLKQLKETSTLHNQ